MIIGYSDPFIVADPFTIFDTESNKEIGILAFFCFQLFILYFYHHYQGKIWKNSIKRIPESFFGKVIPQKILAWEVWPVHLLKVEIIFDW